MGSEQVSTDVIALYAAFDAMPLGVALLASDGRITYANERLRTMLGFSQQELSSRSLVGLTHAGDAAGDQALLEELLEGERDHYELHKRFVCKDGKIFWGKQRVTCQRGGDEDGNATKLVATIEDVTSAQATETKLRGLVEALDERVKELTALHKAARLLLPARAELADQLLGLAQSIPAAMQYPETSTACVRYGSAQLMTDGHRASEWLLSERFHTADGTEGSIEVAYHEARPTADDGPFLREEAQLLSSLAEMIVAAIDRRHIEQSLRDAHEQLDLAFTATGMGIWEWNVDTGASRWSKHLSRMLEMAETSATFGANTGLLHPEDRPRVVERLKSAAAGLDDLRDFSMRFRTTDGYRSFVGTALIVKDASGRARRILVALVDSKEDEVFRTGMRPVRSITLASG